MEIEPKEIHELPLWKSAEKLDLVSIILKDKKYQRESMGMITHNTKSLIEKERKQQFQGKSSTQWRLFFALQEFIQ